MRLPYFRFYARDYMGAVAHLDNELRGAYMNILCHLWEVEFSSKKDLIFVGFFERKETKKVLEKWMKIECILCVNNDGFYYSKRMESERAKAIQDHEKNRVNGMKGGRPKSKIDNPTVNPNHNPTVNPNESETKTQTQTTHNHNHISNIPTEYIDKEDALFLARAQEIDNYQNHEIEGETPEQKKDLDDAYDALCYAEDGSKKRLEITGSTEKPTIEQLEAFCKAHTKVFLMPYNVEKWWHHWEAQKWIDSNKRRIEWQSKITNMAEDPRFIIKAEKTQTTKEPFKSFAEQKTDHEDCEALRFRYGIIKHKHSTYEELKEIDRLARAEKAKNREQPSQETTNKLLGNIYANLIQTY